MFTTMIVHNTFMQFLIEKEMSKTTTNQANLIFYLSLKFLHPNDDAEYDNEYPVISIALFGKKVELTK